MSAAEQAVAAAAAAAVAAAAAGTPQGGTSRPLIVTSGLPAATVTAAASIPVSAAQLASIPMSMALAGLPPGHPALAQVQQQVQAAMAQQVNVNVAQAMAQAAAQAAAAGVALPAGLHAQFQQQQQQLHQAAAAAAAAAVQAAHSHPPDTRGVPAPPPGPPAQGTPAAPHTAGLSLGTVDPQAAERAQKAAEAMARGNEWAAEPLFGGAMELELPLRFTDISKYRPVPDHQEVRLHTKEAPGIFEPGMFRSIHPARRALTPL